MSNLGIIIGREFKERVAKKSFIITTILMPLFMLLLMAAPALIAMMSSPKERVLAVVDESNIVLPALVSAHPENIVIMPVAEPLDSVMHSDKYDAVLAVPADVTKTASATLYQHERANSAASSSKPCATSV